MHRFLRRLRNDDGMTTAEYAVGTIAACAFAAVLYKVVTSGGVLSALGRIIESALDIHL
jgi:Flp pilus assembly pilin Flp